MNIEIFKSMSLELKGDFIFQKGSFVAKRNYGFLDFALYKTESFYVEVTIEKESLKITDVELIEIKLLKKIYPFLKF